MGQPITVVEKPSSNPAILRFETNRPLSGMGHETYTTTPSELLDRPVDEVARRLFAAGGVQRVHVNGSVITVSLSGGHTGTGLADIVRDLFLHYDAAPSAGVTPPTDEGDKAPEATADPGDTPAARTAEEPAAAEPAAPEVHEGSDRTPAVAEPVSAPVEGVPDDQLAEGTPAEGVGTENEPTEGAIGEEPKSAADLIEGSTDPET